MKLVINPAARRDLLERHDYYQETAGVAIAKKFQHSTEKTLAHLCAFPNTGSPLLTHHENLNQLRLWPLVGFTDTLVFYKTETDETIFILRVLHAAQDWQELVKE